MKKYVYRDGDGVHWPDANKGDDLYYAIDPNVWLACEVDSLVSISWEVEEPLVSTDSFIAEDGIAHIKLLTPRVGYYKVTAIIFSQEETAVQKNVVPMKIKVY